MDRTPVLEQAQARDRAIGPIKPVWSKKSRFVLVREKIDKIEQRRRTMLHREREAVRCPKQGFVELEATRLHPVEFLQEA
ncbi:hypothetical protein D3C73_1524480 [compost metagenome]